MKNTVFGSSFVTAMGYSIFQIAVFMSIFALEITDGKQTTGMYFIVSIGISLLASLLFSIYKLILKKKLPSTTFYDTIGLYFAFEIAFLIVAGEVAFFGVGYALHITKGSIYADISESRKSTELAFSISCIVAFLLIYVWRKLLKTKTAAPDL